MEISTTETPESSTTATTITTIKATTEIKIQEANAIVDDDNDWNKPFTKEELEAIDAVEAAAKLSASSSSPSLKSPDFRPKQRRGLPSSIDCNNVDSGSGSGSGSGSSALQPCLTTRPQASMKMKYPAINFDGRIVYARTVMEVQKATFQILKLVEARKQETGRCVLGLDIEWKPSFTRGIPQGKAAVMQICGDMGHCYVLHIIHSGIPQCLKYLLEDSTCIKVGVGIDSDAVKVFHDHNVSIQSVEDLSTLANQKLCGPPKQWSLSSLVEMLTCKQLLKPKKIRLGNWENKFLSDGQLRYAATDAFASWYLYEVMNDLY